MKTETFVIEPIQENAYVYYDEAAAECVVIDPGGDERRISGFIEGKNLAVKAVLLTHGHFDHFIAANALSKRFGVFVFACEDELDMLSDSAKNYSYVGAGESITIIPDKQLKDGDIFPLAADELKVIHTPGHSKGGVCYYSEKNKTLFSGDTLFASSIGRTDLYGGDGPALFRSIKTKLFTLPPDVAVYPGHGKPTTIGLEIAENPFFNR